MILTEEEHLQNIFGEAYTRYRQEVPRYFPGFPG
jgi:protein-S-isoprenylcysteine O-methyltransferase Ste14